MKRPKRPVAPAPSKTGSREVKEKAPMWPWYCLGGILALVLLLYAGMLHHEIITFDDNEYFQNYPEVRDLSWASVQKYFSTYYLIMYQPLPVLTFAINYHFTGLETGPLHTVNLLFHLLNIVLVFLFIRKLTANAGMAVVVSLLFGIHPMNVEAVTWISARSSTMYTCFYIAALIHYINYLKRGKSGALIYTYVFFLLSLFSKAQAVTLPVVLLLLDYFFARDLKKPAVWLQKIPFFILSIVFGLVTLADTDTMHNLTAGMMINYNAVDMIFMFTYSFAFYIMKLILPVGLCAVYVFPPKEGGLLPWEYYASFVMVAGLAWLIWKNRKHKWVLLGTGLFLITIAINIQVIPSRLFIVTDRYAYFPYVGLFLLIVMGLHQLNLTHPAVYRKRFPTFIAVLAAYTLFFSISVVARNQVWENDITFLTDVIKKNPEVPYMQRAFGNRALAYKARGSFNEALDDMNRTVSLNNTDSRSYYNRSLVHMAMNNYRLAAADLDTAGTLDTAQWIIYRERAQVRLMTGDTVGANADIGRLMQLDPENPDGYNVLATIAFARAEYAQTEQFLTEALTRHPDFALGYKNRGLLYRRLGRNSEACSDFQQGSNLGNQDAKMLFSQYCR